MTVSDRFATDLDYADERFGTLGLESCNPDDTYLDHGDAVWIGAKWDVALTADRFHLYRKGNWVLGVGSVDLTEAIIRDQEGR